MSWAIWAVVLGWQERKNIWLYGADYTLFVLPFFRMGRWNDLCMRATIRSRSADLLFQGGLPGLFDREPFTIYQYVDWNSETGINSRILRD